MIRIFSIILSAFLFCAGSNAQSFQIRSVNKGFGVIGVELRKVTGTAPTTQNYITDLVFGLKWNASYNVNLSNDIVTSFRIKKSGPRLVKGSYQFQAFYADQTPFLIPLSWSLNQWVEIMSIANTQSSAGTGNFLICETGFDITTDPNVGIDLVDQAPVVNDSAINVTLPVRLLDFNVNSEKTSLMAKWKTANEINNKGFFLQRSQGDATNFINVAWVDSKNSATTNDYTYEDKNVQPNIDYYYRLQQVDNDDKKSFSQVRKGRINSNGGFVLLPNPVKDILIFTLSTSFNLNEKNLIRITDSKGAIVYQREETIREHTIKIPVNMLAAGNYFFACEKESKVLFSQSFIKL